MDKFLLSVLKQGIAFLYRERFEGDELVKEPVGTCFFAGRATPERKSVYLVTAWHVLSDLTGGDGDMFVRVNLVGPAGGVEYIRLPKSAGWRKHPDEQVDLAVLPWFPFMVGANVASGGEIAEEPIPNAAGGTLYTLPVEVIASASRYAEEWGKSWPPDEGERVFFVGLLLQHAGDNRNYPAFRMGHIAVNTDEPIDLEGGYSRYRLIESQSYRGNSGAPVWVYYEEPGQPDRWAFLGVLTVGFPSETEMFNNKTYYNYGISAVVPSEYLAEMLIDLENERDARPKASRDR